MSATKARTPSLAERVEALVSDIDAELESLEPEFKRITEEMERLRDMRGRITGQTPTRRTNTRSANSGSRPARGQRQQEFDKLVQDEPGLTSNEIGKKLGIATAYVYRLRDKADVAGTLKVEEGRYYPADHDPTTPDPARIKELEAATS